MLGILHSKRYAHSAGPVKQNKLLRKENSVSQNSFHREVCLQTYTGYSDLEARFEQICRHSSDLFLTF